MFEDTTKLENALKQEQLAHSQCRKDLGSLEEKEKENEVFLVKEAKKSKKLNEEMGKVKDRNKELEEEINKAFEIIKSIQEYKGENCRKRTRN